MARQPLRKRKKRYQERFKAESERVHALLQRQEIRFERGDYRKQLTEEEHQRVGRLLFLALEQRWKCVRGRLIILGLRSLEERRQLYFKICKILRQAGNRTPSVKEQGKSPKFILRRKNPSPDKTNP